jgi:hypothetical protein
MSRSLAALPVLVATAGLTVTLGLGGCGASQDVFVIDLSRCTAVSNVQKVEITISDKNGRSDTADYDVGGTVGGTLGARVPANLGKPLTVTAVAVGSDGSRVSLGTDTTDGSATASPCSGAGPGDGGPDADVAGDADLGGPDIQSDVLGPDGMRTDGSPPDGGDGCMPHACAPGTCGMQDNGCGQMQPCNTCGAEQTCNTSTSMCRCSDMTSTACGASCVRLDADSSHCGACDHTCRGGGCLGGSCQEVLIAMGQNRPTELATDDSGVYWTNAGTSGMSDGQVIAMPVADAFPAATTVIRRRHQGPGAAAAGPDRGLRAEQQRALPPVEDRRSHAGVHPDSLRPLQPLDPRRFRLHVRLGR